MSIRSAAVAVRVPLVAAVAGTLAVDDLSVTIGVGPTMLTAALLAGLPRDDRGRAGGTGSGAGPPASRSIATLAATAPAEPPGSWDRSPHACAGRPGRGTTRPRRGGPAADRRG